MISWAAKNNRRRRARALANTFVYTHASDLENAGLLNKNSRLFDVFTTVKIRFTTIYSVVFIPDFRESPLCW